jgi:hypothetical protein
MSKEALKLDRIEKQNGKCAISKKNIEMKRTTLKLVDTDRKNPKASGGTYIKENTRVVTPQAHMKRHGTLRERSVVLDEMKSLMDDRTQVMKLRNKINNQLLADERRTDKLSTGTIEMLKMHLEQIKDYENGKTKQVNKIIKEWCQVDPLAAAAIGVPSVGPITILAMAVYVDLAKADHASSLWKYCGLHTASHKRYVKGEAGGGNKTLRTVLYTMADSQVKGRGPYREVYDQVKTRLEQSEKIVESRNTQGKLVEVAWKDTKPCHRHGAALRAVMKHFLADYWMVGRTLAGLDTSPIYAEAMLGGGHKTIAPETRGWVY